MIKLNQSDMPGHKGDELDDCEYLSDGVYPEPVDNSKLNNSIALM